MIQEEPPEVIQEEVEEPIDCSIVLDDEPDTFTN